MARVGTKSQGDRWSQHYALKLAALFHPDATRGRDGLTDGCSHFLDSNSYPPRDSPNLPVGQTLPTTANMSAGLQSKVGSLVSRSGATGMQDSGQVWRRSSTSII